MKVQILLTSHSPLVLSDLPRENLILLEKKDKTNNCPIIPNDRFENTFGGNLHYILADEFFLEGGLVGKFAKEKIQKVIDYMKGKNHHIDIETCKKIINKIGEPVVRRHLLEMFYEKFGQNSEDWIDSEIERLQKLKNKTNSDNDDQN